ncbi:hypothetical protein ACP3V3_16930 [Vibrio sp. PNB22_3_1]
MAYGTNTGERFISLTGNRYKISIPTPHDEDKPHRKSISFKGDANHHKSTIDQATALKKAIAYRDEKGKSMWGKWWPKVRNSETFLLSLPKTLEPKIQTLQRKHWLHQRYVVDKYIDGQRLPEYFPFNGKADKLSAYAKAKRRMLEIHKPVLKVLEMMGRVPIGTKFH